MGGSSALRSKSFYLAELQKLRNIYDARPEHGRALVTDVIASFPICPIPEVARLGRTLRVWKAAILAYFDTNGTSTAPPKRSTASSKPHAESHSASATSPLKQL